MKQHRFCSALLAGALASLSLSACVQMPTEKQQVVDLKAQVSFAYTNAALANAQVVVDGLPMGVAGSYQAGVAALKLKPGTHHIQVNLGAQRLLDEKIYVGDGVSKTFDIR